jgi:chemotaxis methyl-accepting protein methylase
VTMPGPGQDAFRRASALLAGRIGMRVEGSMRGRVERALRDGAAARGESPERFARALGADPAALQVLVDAVTVPESRFFRDPQHFDVLVRCALPELPGPGVVWSAGCANGQEAWSLAMALEECGATDWRVLATDVSSRAVARTESGRYSEHELGGLSAARRAQFFRQADDGRWEVGARLRGRVHVRRHNLAEAPPPWEAGARRVVFCRNVLIYFDQDTKIDVLSRIGRMLPPDGYLTLGAAETVVGLTSAFKPHAERRGLYVLNPDQRLEHRRAALPGVSFARMR